MIFSCLKFIIKSPERAKISNIIPNTKEMSDEYTICGS